MSNLGWSSPHYDPVRVAEGADGYTGEDHWPSDSPEPYPVPATTPIPEDEVEMSPKGVTVEPEGAWLKDDVSVDVEDMKKDAPEDEPPKKWWQKKKKKKAGKEEKEKPKQVTFVSLFRYADKTDKWWMAIGAACGVATGAALPAFSYIFGRLINELATNTKDVKSKTSELSLWMTLIGIGTWILTAIGVALFSVSGERQVRVMRRSFFSAILDQEAAYFDQVKAGELTNRISSDMTIVSTLLGNKLFLLISYLSTFFLSFVFAFIQSWRLTLLMLGVTPILAIAGAAMAKVMSEATTKAQEAYAKAGAIAQEVLSSIRTVHAFDGMDRECHRYNERLKETQKVGVRKGLFMGLSQGITFFILFSSYAVAFYFGSYLIEWGFDTGGSVISVFFSILIGAFQLGACGPIFTAIAEARGAAFKVYEIVDRVPTMKAQEDAPGKVLTSVEGHIEFRDVAFTYPARPDVPIFRGFNLTVNPGQKVALVGPSGSGKSSIVALIERFYDPDGGVVLVDGTPLPDINLYSWRKQVGIVTQEPTLFQATVLENIRCANPAASEADVVQACKDAFIHDVISKLPDGYNTVVGEAGSQLSGGQKQRVAIARAIIKNPKVLLLDEATSALDRQSELIVQQALKNVMQGRTVVTIAHRLVTIQDCDLICYIEPRDAAAAPGSLASASRLLESGTHQELMSLERAYSAMVHAQTRAAEQIESEAAIEACMSGRNYDGRMETLVDNLEDADVIAGDNNDDAGEKDNKGQKKKRTHVFRRTAKLNSPDKVPIGVGVLAAAVAGASYPLYSFVFSEVVNVFYQSNMREVVWKWCLLFVAIGFMNFVCYTLKLYCLNRAGENLTYRLRSMLFRCFTSQDVGFFDMPGNESGALCARLSSDTTQIQHIFARAIGTNAQAAVCLITGVLISFVSSWELALVVVSSLPPVIIAGYFHTKLMARFHKKSGKDLDAAGQVANEAINGHRTVFAFNMQQSQVARYDNLLAGPAKVANKMAVVSGLFIGFSQFSIFAAFALAFWYGGQMIGDHKLGFTEVLKSANALLTAAMGVSEVYAMAADQAAAKAADTRVYETLDRVPPIDTVGDEGLKLSSVSGYGTYQDVQFSYPSRPTVPILKMLNLSFHTGQRVAIMGSTGCGKSTVIALLMRYYDPTAGAVLPDGHRLPELNLRNWRSFLGIVSQEPTLFDDTIANNIKYGKPDATDEEMYEAAKKANIHHVILSLPKGYQTNVGAKGSQLSGGQKQRVAIARCIIRKPAILLLDEATSALDNVSEKEVQAALDHIVMEEKMTVITVAHRLSTIKNCNLIVIMDEGRVVEVGSHEQLYALGGDYKRRYNQYYNIQS